MNDAERRTAERRVLEILDSMSEPHPAYDVPARERGMTLNQYLAWLIVEEVLDAQGAGRPRPDVPG